jgi:hypothetical protein
MAAGIAAPVVANVPWSPPPLERCVRLMANRSDCGGFFVALLRKVAPLPATPTPEWPHTHQHGERAKAGTKASAKAGATAEPAGLASDKPEGIASYAYVAVPSEVSAECAAVVASAGLAGSAKAARKLLKGRLFRRGARGNRIVYLTEDCERICCGARGGGTVAPRLNVVNAGATVFKRRRRRTASGGDPTWSLTAVGRSLLKRLVRADS